MLDLIPDAATVTSLPTGDLAGYVLEVLLTSPDQRQLWCRQSFCMNAAEQYRSQSHNASAQVGQACSEAWSWLEINELICQTFDDNYGRWYCPTRRAAQINDRQSVKALIAASELPEHFLHPLIALHSRSLFLQARFDSAVFEAFKTVEVEMRSIAKLGNELVGTKLASRAFDPKDGPLTDLEAEMGEREALRNLMVGALGTCKNPSSHRRVALTADDARAMLMFASFLLNVINRRLA